MGKSLALTMEFYLTLRIPNLYPVKIYRCLKRHGLNILPDEFVNNYNMNTRLKSLNYKTPSQYLKEEKDIIIQRIVI
jgi:hypothetical protein